MRVGRKAMKERKKLFAYPRPFAIAQVGIVLKEGGIVRSSQEAAEKGVPYAWALREYFLSRPA